MLTPPLLAQIGARTLLVLRQWRECMLNHTEHMADLLRAVHGPERRRLCELPAATASTWTGSLC